MPPFDAAGSDQVLVVRSSSKKDTFSVQEKTFTDQTSGDDHNDKDAPVNSPAPS